MTWTFQKGPRRVFGSILGHYTWTMTTHVSPDGVARPGGLAWAAGEPTERFGELAL